MHEEKGFIDHSEKGPYTKQNTNKSHKYNNFLCHFRLEEDYVKTVRG